MILGTAAATVFVIWVARHVILLAFAGVLLGIFLQMTSRAVSRWTHLRHGWALTATVATLLLLAALGVWRTQHAIVQQVQQLAESVPTAIDGIEARLDASAWGRSLRREVASSFAGGSALNGDQMISQAKLLSGKLLSFVVGLIVVFFVGLYAAAEPDLYRTGMLKLIPVRHRSRVAEVLRDLQRSLESWILAQLTSMLIVGTLISLGLWMLGVKGALVLGMLAAMLELIPTFGPLLAASPAVLAGLAEGPSTAAGVAALYLAVQLLEGYVILPLIQQRAVDIPPALLIVMIVLLGYLAGALGALIATPLLVTIMVLINDLYREDYLGEPT